MSYYINTIHSGLDFAGSNGDGYGINIRWNRAFPSIKLNSIAYHIYYSELEDQVFTEGPKFVSTDGSLMVDLQNMIPGQLYHFATRAVQYNSNISSFSSLPIAYNGLRTYPISVLRSNLGVTDLLIQLADSEAFPQSGLIQVGTELINYVANDLTNNNLIVAGGTLPQNAGFVRQSNNQFILPNPANIGQGSINNLNLVNYVAIAETWTIKCIFVERDSFNNPIATTAKFEAFGSISKGKYDQFGNAIVWNVLNQVMSNGVLSFSISETTTFREGDSFIVQTVGAISGINGRGFNDTLQTFHNTDGFDGYNTWPTNISYVLGEEETNTVIFPCQSRFDVGNDQFRIMDGYHQVTKDILTTDLSASDDFNVGFNSYDYAGWRRTDPVMLLSGECVGSYFGGQQFCADGYNGVGGMIRGLSFQERNNQRQEYLLSLTGEPVCLVKRQWTGITCRCFLPGSEYPDDRCPICFGGKFVVNWNQYFNPRRSDGRIMVRFSPSDDDLKQYESGLESEMISDVWTLTVPTVKDRDFIVRFDENDTEEFRYEILSVNRNRTLTRLEGAQKFRVQRVRKTDPIYNVPVFRNTQYLPRDIMTGIGSTTGLPAHQHSVRIDENITSLNQVNQLTGIAMGHNHQIRNGLVIPVLGHTHSLILS